MSVSAPGLQRRRSSLVGAVIDVEAIGKPSPKPRMHKRSLTGNYEPLNAKGEKHWPLGDEKVWTEALKADADLSVPSIQKSIVHNLTTTLARQAYNLVGADLEAYQATALSARDTLIRNWNLTTSYHSSKSPKRIYYLSLEFLLGRALDNALLNLDIKTQFSDAVHGLGFRLEDLLENERDAGLGNGGLGRLAACYVDAFATLELPGWGYGLRYQFGIFKQYLDQNGAQLEAPDPWLDNQNAWEIPRLDVTVRVRFYGEAERVGGAKGKAVWKGGQEVLAVAYDVPIPGHGTRNTSNIRFWSAKPISGFDLRSFDAGDYQASVEASQSAETITRVLYPNDNNDAGKELRLKQQYFWTAASLSDILRRFRKLDKPWVELSDFIAIQLNDTHPTLAIPELVRILVDEEDVDFDTAWGITQKVFSYTNHTVLPEALEKWGVPLMSNLLPRIMQIIFDLNHDFMVVVDKIYPGDLGKMERMSLIQEGYPQSVRMANLAVVGSHKVNGVAALHSELVQSQLFPDFVELFGRDKFTNVTNGIAPRRWLNQCNPELSQLITKTLGSADWLKHLDLLKGLLPHATEPKFRKEWEEIKTRNKARLAHLVHTELGVVIPTHACFDVQIKRLHEYKRQQMNIYSVIHRYLTLKGMSPAERKKCNPHVAVFAGKSAPGYFIAKLIIRLISSVQKLVNADKDVGDYLKVVFIPDYSVSLAEVIIPAADVSVQISTAGTEASGTSNMKLSLNGALMLGTVDGANIEIAEKVGEENVFFFGFLTPDVEAQRRENLFHPVPVEKKSPALAAVFKAIESGMFGDYHVFAPLIESVTQHGDNYLVADDFESYLDAQALLDETFKDRESWITKSITTVANMGFFSSDRAVATYCEEIWNVEPLRVPDSYKG
ncbi:glycosyltransferase family 35 protein [Mrakia frigida]|uniref:glycogen phosphorylase n=1 Tax=Mrakia frigida TaxID=29902 RepID=UPI003FCC1594